MSIIHDDAEAKGKIKAGLDGRRGDQRQHRGIALAFTWRAQRLQARRDDAGLHEPGAPPPAQVRLGAEIVLTPASEGMPGAVRRAEEIVAKTPGSYMAQQFANPANPEDSSGGRRPRRSRNDTEGKGRHHRLGRRHGRDVITGCGEGAQASQAGPEDGRRRADELAGPDPDPRGEPAQARPATSSRAWGRGFVPDVLNVEVIDEVVQVGDTGSRSEMRPPPSAKEEDALRISCGMPRPTRRRSRSPSGRRTPAN